MAPASAAASSLRPPPGLGIGSGLGIGRTHPPATASAETPSDPININRGGRHLPHAGPKRASADTASTSVDSSLTGGKSVSPQVVKPPAVPAVVLSASKRAPHEPSVRVRYTIQTLLNLSGPPAGEPGAHPAPADTTPFHIWYGVFPNPQGGAGGGRNAPSYRAPRPDGGEYGYSKRHYHGHGPHDEGEREGRPHGSPSASFKAPANERRALPRRRGPDADESEEHHHHHGHPNRDGTADAAPDWRRPVPNSRANRKQQESVPSWMDEDSAGSGPAMAGGMDDIQAFKLAMREAERTQPQGVPSAPPGLSKSVGPPPGLSKPSGPPPGLGMPSKGDDSLESDHSTGKRDITPTDMASPGPATGRSSRFARFFDSASMSSPSTAQTTQPASQLESKAAPAPEPAAAPQIDLAALFGTVNLSNTNPSSNSAPASATSNGASAPAAAPDEQASMAKVLAMLAGSAGAAGSVPTGPAPPGLAPPPQAPPQVAYYQEYSDNAFSSGNNVSVPGRPNQLVSGALSPPQDAASPGSSAGQSPSQSRGHNMRSAPPPRVAHDHASGPVFPMAQGPPGMAPPGLPPHFAFPPNFFPPEGMPPPSRQPGPGMYDPYSARAEADATMLLNRGQRAPPGPGGMPPVFPPGMMPGMMSNPGMVPGPGGMPMGLPPHMQPPPGWKGYPPPPHGPSPHGGAGGPPPGLSSGPPQPPPWAQGPLPPSAPASREFIAPSPSNAGHPASAADLMAFLTGGNPAYGRQ